MDSGSTPPTRTLLTVGMNNLPQFPRLDDTGLAIRLEIIQCHNTIRDTKQDNKRLKEELKTQPQLDGLFNYLLLPRIKENLKRGGLKYIQDEKEAMRGLTVRCIT